MPSYDQRLPLPLGGPDPVRKYGRLWAIGGRDWLRILLLAGGVLTAVGGGVLGSLQPPVEVKIDSQGYHVGNLVLSPQNSGGYASIAGAVVIDPISKQAGGSTTLHGAKMLGHCRLASDLRSESCYFQVGDKLFSAQDSLEAQGWKRRYEDGQQVEIRLPGGPVPVPIAIGR